jgi:hypothetical protein
MSADFKFGSSQTCLFLSEANSIRADIARQPGCRRQPGGIPLLT